MLYLALGGLTLGSFYSCEELENLCNISEADLQTGEVFVSSLNNMVDIYKRVDAANKSSDLASNGIDTIDQAVCTIEGDSLFIDFGIGEVVCQDGKLRKGSIRTKITGDYTTTNGMVSSKLSNYHVNGTQLTGSFMAENKGPAANPLFTLSTSEFKEGDLSEVDYSLSSQWVQGFSTEEEADDIFDLSGTVSGSAKENNVNFTTMILSPLHYVSMCPSYVEYGVLNLEVPTDSIAIEIDFLADDGCNNLFQATIDCEGSPFVSTFPIE